MRGLTKRNEDRRMILKYATKFEDQFIYNNGISPKPSPRSKSIAVKKEDASPPNTKRDHGSCDSDGRPVYEPTYSWPNAPRLAVEEKSPTIESAICPIQFWFVFSHSYQSKTPSKPKSFPNIPSLVFRYRVRDPDDDDEESDRNRNFVSFIEKTLILCKCSKLKKLGFDLRALRWRTGEKNEYEVKNQITG
ncbi:hypothetical protein Acr_08g0006150 [Actinidia rufa]|uniref:Uncharacterized protein n=1 Tax=Actinidia rufa TaxID=165716 RepID=A0A7J0F1Y5_9ERIC|nr:hypothetical protein Acr_08g0006150 [Actinidia rufa]